MGFGIGQCRLYRFGCMTLDHADDEPSGKNVRCLMVPRDKIIFHDTWHTMGLCGTSSGDVELRQCARAGGA